MDQPRGEVRKAGPGHASRTSDTSVRSNGWHPVTPALHSIACTGSQPPCWWHFSSWRRPCCACIIAAGSLCFPCAERAPVRRSWPCWMDREFTRSSGPSRLAPSTLAAGTARLSPRPTSIGSPRRPHHAARPTTHAVTTAHWCRALRPRHRRRVSWPCFQRHFSSRRCSR